MKKIRIMKKYRKKIMVGVQVIFCILLIFSGYVLNEILWDREHRFPKMPKLPKAFQGYEFENVDAPWNLRNEQIEKFYLAWKNNETYGIYEASVGIDSLIRSYWLTEKGKVKLIRVIEAPFWEKKTYPVWEIEDISVGYWNDDELIEVDPIANRQYDLILQPKGDAKKSTIIE
jgi:hypothetical protein